MAWAAYNYVHQPTVMTFVFSSVFILLLWFQLCNVTWFENSLSWQRSHVDYTLLSARVRCDMFSYIITIFMSLETLGKRRRSMRATWSGRTASWSGCWSRRIPATRPSRRWRARSWGPPYRTRMPLPSLSVSEFCRWFEVCGWLEGYRGFLN